MDQERWEGVASERPGTAEYSQQAGRIRQAEDEGEEWR